jgi:hypothetical protein
MRLGYPRNSDAPAVVIQSFPSPMGHFNTPRLFSEAAYHRSSRIRHVTSHQEE